MPKRPQFRAGLRVSSSLTAIGFWRTAPEKKTSSPFPELGSGELDWGELDGDQLDGGELDGGVDRFVVWLTARSLGATVDLGAESFATFVPFSVALLKMPKRPHVRAALRVSSSLVVITAPDKEAPSPFTGIIVAGEELTGDMVFTGNRDSCSAGALIGASLAGAGD